MKMSNAFLCCDTCFEAIGKRNTKAAKLWIDLCSIFIEEEGPFDLIIDDELLLRQVELLGYIITTDNGHFIGVKVLGFQQDAEGVYFCPRGCFDV